MSAGGHGEASPVSAGGHGEASPVSASDFPGRSPLLRSAYDYARAVHSGQRLETDGAPYFHHPLAVGAMLHEAGFRPEVAAAGLLHDTVEDSDTGVGDLTERFGARVAELVASVTEPDGVEPYEERKARHREQVAGAGYEAGAIFAADKVSSTRNLRGALAVRGEQTVQAGLEQPLDSKLAHYEATLLLLERELPGLPFLEPLRSELSRLQRQRARSPGPDETPAPA